MRCIYRAALLIHSAGNRVAADDDVQFVEQHQPRNVNEANTVFASEVLQLSAVMVLPIVAILSCK